MSGFEPPTDLMNNRGLIEDPVAFARDKGSALIYLYAGLRAGASAEDVLARAETDDAALARSDELRGWVRDGLEQLS